MRRGDFGSSLSDDESYPDFCRSAASTDSVFASFRADDRYRVILEHVNKDLGRRYLERAMRSDSVRDMAWSVCASDNIGAPTKFDYEAVGLASPTTLRYLSVSADLRDLFGPLEGFDILEIGVGYGGQCRVTDLIERPRSWGLVDLPPVLELALRFTRENAVATEVTGYSAFGGDRKSSDLLLSNYAFSELRRDVQEDYFTRFVESAKRGHVTLNSVSPRAFNGPTAREFADRVGGSIRKERPLSYPGNKVVVWGTQ